MDSLCPSFIKGSLKKESNTFIDGIFSPTGYEIDIKK